MLFNSFQFAYFFADPASRSTGCLPHRRGRTSCCWPRATTSTPAGTPSSSSLLILSTVMDYACGLAVDRIEDARKRKLFVALSMALNLGMLGYFKYFNFFAESLQAALATGGPARAALAQLERRAADRHLVLHVPVDELRHRRLPPGHQADAELHRVRGVRLVLPAPGRRADHAADDAPAADRARRGGSTSSSSTRGPT